EDLLRGGPGGRGHPEDEPSGDLLIRGGHVDVRVVADRPVGFIEHDQAHLVQGDPLRPDVVPDHLRGRHDDLVLPPEELPFLGGRRLAGEKRDPIDDEDLPQGGRMLLDEGFRWCKEETLPPFRRRTSAITIAATTVFPMPVGRTTSVDRSRQARAMFTWYALSSTAPRRSSSCVTATSSERRGVRIILCTRSADDVADGGRRPRRSRSRRQRTRPRRRAPRESHWTPSPTSSSTPSRWGRSPQTRR